MIDAPLAVAFAAGLVATVNPCGFAMLPAYLSYFLGSEGDEDLDSARSVGRALAVGGAVSAGFLLVFGVAGVLIAHLSLTVYDISPWITVVIGAALAALGVAMLLGFEPVVALPKLNRGGRDRGMASMFLFGLSYAIASLSCTLPVFLSAVGSTFTRANFASGVAVFAAYSAGMILVLLVLTVALALARHSLVRRLKQSVRYVNRAAGVLLVVAGGYVAWYGITEIRLDTGATGGGAVDFVTEISTDISTWVQDTGATRIGTVLALLVAAATAFSLRRRRA